jgi:hypothetical protein
MAEEIPQFDPSQPYEIDAPPIAEAFVRELRQHPWFAAFADNLNAAFMLASPS